jgi:hypothetical protein
MSYGKGNRKLQRKRHRRNNHGIKRQDSLYELIDGNMSYFPYAYCRYHKGYLTKNMVILHKCGEKRCNKYIAFKEKEKMKNEGNFTVARR